PTPFHPGTQAINPGGLGAKPPALPCLSIVAFSFIRLLTEPFHGSFRTLNSTFVGRANGWGNPQIGNRPSKIGNPKSASDSRPRDPDAGILPW
ncbi:MAG: hypothetical protein ABSF71_35685, partial [Terriglobia bacterium]